MTDPAERFEALHDVIAVMPPGAARNKLAIGFHAELDRALGGRQTGPASGGAVIPLTDEQRARIANAADQVWNIVFSPSKKRKVKS